LHPLARLVSPGRIALVAAVFALALWAMLIVPLAPVLDTLEEMSGDWAWRLAAERVREQRLILVDIDEASLARLGPWPWPRQRLAALSDRLADEGAALQIFDIVLPAATEDDTLLAERLTAHRAVLSEVFALEPGAHVAEGTPTGALPWSACPPFVARSQGFIANAPAFSSVPTGHITPLIESDGIVRRQPALVCHAGGVYPALFLAALVHAQDRGEPRLIAGQGHEDPAWLLAGLPVGDKGVVPLDAQGNVRIPWTLHPDAFISLSAADVLAGRIPGGLLDNTWVLIGSTALGINDRIATPFGGSGAGLMVHAQLLRGALDGRLPTEPRGQQLYAAAVAVVCAALLGGLVWWRRRLWWAILLAPGLVLLLIGLKMYALVGAGLWLEWTGAALYIAVYAFFLVLLEYARSRLERERLYRHLASYLPGPLAAVLARRDPSGAIEAERTTVIALFADIRNFSAFCEARPPEESVAVLHAFFAMVSRVVEQHGGIVESFHGDAVLAIWSARAQGMAHPGPDAPVAAALDVLRESRGILPPPRSDEETPLALGVGIEAGLATVGSIGPARRRAHLAMGHPVTTAIRLHDMTVELAHPILIGQELAAQLPARQLESLGTFLLEGLTAPCAIYAVPLHDCV